MERRLAAILAADVVGYSRLMEADGRIVTPGSPTPTLPRAGAPRGFAIQGGAASPRCHAPQQIHCQIAIAETVPTSY